MPRIEPHPPCPPRVYNKLYTYFDKLLVVQKCGRPSKVATATSTPTRSLPSRPTPTKAASLAPYRSTPTRALSSRKRGLQFADSTREIAPWIHPTIRALCQESKAPAAAPHILAGVTTILTLPSPSVSGNRDHSTEDKKDKLPALIAAVYFFVRTRLSGKETDGRDYAAQRREVLNTLTHLRENTELEAKIQVKFNEGDVWEGWEKISSKDINSWLLEISTRGWLKLDWFENIVEGAGLEVQNDSGLDVHDSDGTNQPVEGDIDDKSILQTGLGTMMQDRVDYLSERKRQEYRAWKEGILLRIEEIESARTAMDTSEG